MKLRVRNWLSLMGMSVPLVIAVMFLQGCKDGVGGEEEAEAATELAIPVEAAEVSTSDMAAFYSGTATLEADEQAVVVSQITGVVLQINAQEADLKPGTSWPWLKQTVMHLRWSARTPR